MQHDRIFTERAVEVADTAGRQGCRAGYHHVERDRPVAGAHRTGGGICAQRRGATGHIPGGAAQGCGATLFRALAADECRQPRRHIPGRGGSDGLRGDATATVQQPVPAVLAVTSRAIGMAGRTDERYGGSVCQAGPDGPGADPDRVHIRPHRNAVRVGPGGDPRSGVARRQAGGEPERQPSVHPGVGGHCGRASAERGGVQSADAAEVPGLQEREVLAVEGLLHERADGAGVGRIERGHWGSSMKPLDVCVYCAESDEM